MPSAGAVELLTTLLTTADSANSLRTISYAVWSTWYFSRKCVDTVLGKDQRRSLVVLDVENEWHQRVVAGSETLSTLALTHWNSMAQTLAKAKATDDD
jgi:predicted DNA-binding ArsR family transcriptional regulator